MSPPARPEDRYEPLPSLLELPGFFVRKLSRAGRRGLLVAAALIAAAIAVGVPALVAIKDDADTAAQRAAQRAHARSVAALRAELRLVDGGGTPARGLTGAAAVTAHESLVRDLAAAISRDAAERHRTGELAERVKRVDCARYPPAAGDPDPAADPAIRRARYACLAVTAEFKAGAATTGGAIGYPYRALVHFGSGRFTFCKFSGRPGEGSLTRQLDVAIPVACGGAPTR